MAYNDTRKTFIKRKIGVNGRFFKSIQINKKPKDSENLTKTPNMTSELPQGYANL